jgi:DNA-binding SARP family transcriptional activator
LSAPWRIGALRAMGRTQEAYRVYETFDPNVSEPLWLSAVVGPELMIDLGRVGEAREAIARGRRLTRARSSLMSDVFNRLLEVKLELRLTANVERAESLLRQLEVTIEPSRLPFLAEHIATWRGMALLRRGEDAAAARKLRQAVRGMKSANRILELPTAAVFLAEAEWRLDREDAAKKAVDLALEAAARQGSNHILLQALADFPAVVTRRVALEESADSQWHDISRALMADGAPVAPTGRTRIHLAEFGQPTIEVDGVEVRARIKKSYELLAYLASRPSHEAERDELLDVLFGGRADESTRSYLRQAAHRLREVLPEDAILAFEGTRLRLSGDLALSSDSAQVMESLARASHRRGRERLGHLLEAMALIDRGEYLAGVTSTWVDERRQQLVDVAADARHEAAQLLFAEADHAEAKRLATTVLRSNPYREATWRLLMKIANATGDEDGVIDAFRMCERTLSHIGMAPSRTTESLLASLRR